MTITKTASSAPWLPTPSTSLHPKPTSSLNSQTDTVQINSFVKAALQEATETLEQTETEARNGDPQAQRLLAQEEAERKGFETQGPNPKQPWW